MLSDRRLSVVAELIRDHISLDGIDRYCAETGVQSRDFVAVEPCEFDGEVFAIDGSNATVCNWSAANLNLIRAGYAVYRGRDWQRTVITYDDIFLADPRISDQQFDPYLKLLGQKEIKFKETDLDRLSTYFRELQEYIALDDAIKEARSGDLILYDGSFDVFEPLRESLYAVFSRAEERGVALLAIAKSSSLFWGEGISLPFVQHTSIAGSRLQPGVPWYLNLKDKKVEHSQGKWGGETYIVRFSGRCERAFRVDAPKYLGGSVVGPALGKLAAYSCSAECLGYPHALFRAHRDIMINEKEGEFTRLKLMEMLSQGGLSLSQVNILMQDYHDILEMRQGI